MSSRVQQVSSVALTFVTRLHAYAAHDGDLGLVTGLILVSVVRVAHGVFP